MNIWLSATLSVVKESVPNLVASAYSTRFRPTNEGNLAGKETNTIMFYFVLARSNNWTPPPPRIRGQTCWNVTRF
jgi:hypothetical protein